MLRISNLINKSFGAVFYALIPVLTFFIICCPAEGGVQVIPQTVRVCIAQKLMETSFSVQGKYRFVDKQSGDIIGLPRANEEWRISFSGNQIEVFSQDKRIGRYWGPIILEEIKHPVHVMSGSGALIQKEADSELAVQGADGNITYVGGELSDLWVQGGDGVSILESSSGLNLVNIKTAPGEPQRAYRGEFEIRSAEGGLLIINQLAIEDYLYGVVPAEMPSFFPTEALKAQAVVARSYLIANLGNYSSQGYDLLSTQSNQVYKGYSAEHPVTSSAVNATRGEVLIFRGQPIAAFFHSSSGGYTENSEDVWNSSLPYIRSKTDPFDQCEENMNHYNWQVVYTLDQLLRQFLSQGYRLQQISDLKVLEVTTSGKRVKKLLITGIDMQNNPKSIEVTGADAVRKVLGLKSAMFSIDKEYDEYGALKKVTLMGNGWGHGLGMSQWGARGMAKQGYNYLEILQYYYTGVSITQNYGL